LSAAAHAWQSAVQAVAQHTSSTQKPLPHSVAKLQAAPSILRHSPLAMWHS
jgi:hypothetical protein